jgi:hypothetical protein
LRTYSPDITSTNSHTNRARESYQYVAKKLAAFSGLYPLRS